MGLATLQVYESALTAIADTLKRGPGSSDVDVIARIATAQADLLRELTKSWSAAARRALK
jgi:hypothetical protein